jgi:hypothetical protein
VRWLPAVRGQHGEPYRGGRRRVTVRSLDLLESTASPHRLSAKPNFMAQDKPSLRATGGSISIIEDQLKRCKMRHSSSRVYLSTYLIDVHSFSGVTLGLAAACDDGDWFYACDPGLAPFLTWSQLPKESRAPQQLFTQPPIHLHKRKYLRQLSRPVQ